MKSISIEFAVFIIIIEKKLLISLRNARISFKKTQLNLKQLKLKSPILPIPSINQCKND